eukprot:CAMPEP_0195100164 /NCGR_PEP_ID=MMETSP0448-20130528/61375_1 /TAXON_ID=66468 /ORGANISM="Heterocapsa triquestra, Strain CCMP 448" /LENGTH=31 /DNA_ID= /DNA_START= /DNA_END= /DNA_ORIENTATION=
MARSPIVVLAALVAAAWVGFSAFIAPSQAPR